MSSKLQMDMFIASTWSNRCEKLGRNKPSGYFHFLKTEQKKINLNRMIAVRKAGEGEIQIRRQWHQSFKIKNKKWTLHLLWNYRGRIQLHHRRLNKQKKYKSVLSFCLNRYFKLQVGKKVSEISSSEYLKSKKGSLTVLLTESLIQWPHRMCCINQLMRQKYAPEKDAISTLSIFSWKK